MAVYCPMYDPSIGWYIIVCGPYGSYKKTIISPLNYYHSLGIKPPIGAKFTQQDYMNFEMDLEDQSIIDAAAAPFESLNLSSLSLPKAMTSFTPPGFTSSSQAAAASVFEFDDPHLISTAGPSSISSPFDNPATASTAPSPLLLSSSLSCGQFGSSPPLPTSPFISSLSHSSASNIPTVSSELPLQHLATLTYLLSLPSTSGSSQHLHDLPSTSSGYFGVLPPIGTPSPQTHSAEATNSSNVNDDPVPLAYYDDSLAQGINPNEFDEVPMEADDFDF